MADVRDAVPDESRLLLDVRSMLVRASSASSLKEPFLISYVATRRCFMCSPLLVLPDHPGPTRSQIESEMRLRYQVFAGTQRPNGMTEAILVTATSPVEDGIATSSTIRLSMNATTRWNEPPPVWLSSLE